MNTPWGYPDFDAHEALHFVTDEKSGLRAIIAMHSTHLGPAAGGTRFWHYADDADALTDALRLSRGMSYKNAMAGLPLGGGKAVVLANKTAHQDAGDAGCLRRGGEFAGRKYVTAEDVGMSVADMIEISKQTKFVAGLPVGGGAVGGDPGPHTSLGVFLGIKAAVKRALGKDSLSGLHIACRAPEASRRVSPARPRPKAQAIDRRRRSRRAERSLPRPAARWSYRTRSCSSRPTWSAPARWARS